MEYSKLVTLDGDNNAAELNFPSNTPVQDGTVDLEIPKPKHVNLPLPPVGPHKTIVVCPFCTATVRTRIKHKVTSRTHMVALHCFPFAICCLCCLPYCLNSTQNVDHYCSECKRFIGTYNQ